MPEERIWILIARKVSGEATEDELQELESVLQANTEIQFTIETLYKLWGNTAPGRHTVEINKQQILSRIQREQIPGEFIQPIKRNRINF